MMIVIIYPMVIAVIVLLLIIIIIVIIMIIMIMTMTMITTMIVGVIIRQTTINQSRIVVPFIRTSEILNPIQMATVHHCTFPPPGLSSRRTEHPPTNGR